jgi:hypothetical protein
MEDFMTPLNPQETARIKELQNKPEAQRTQAEMGTCGIAVNVMPENNS